MGIFDKVFKKKDKDLLTEPPIPPEIKTSQTPLPLEQQMDPNRAAIESVRVKLDLVLTEIDSLKTQNQMLNERLKSIEKKLEERPIRYI